MSQAKIKKEADVKGLVEKFNRAKGIIFTNFKGLTVADTTDFRKKVKKANIEYKVIKNNIVCRALKLVNLEDVSKLIEGPTGVMISYDDPVTPAKIIKDFVAEHENLKIRIGVLEGKAIDLAKIKYLAELPPKDVLIAKVIGGMKGPLFSLVFVLKGGLNKLVYALEGVKKNKK